MMNNPGITNRI